MEAIIPRARCAQHHLVNGAADGLLVGAGDATEFEMALLNLAVNARDAMPNGGTFSLTSAQRRSRLRRAPPGRRARSHRAVRAARPATASRQGTWRSLRPVLHHQGTRQGHRPGTEPGLWLRPAIRRHGLQSRSPQDTAPPSPFTCRPPPRPKRSRAPLPMTRRRVERHPVVLVVDDSAEVARGHVVTVRASRL